jgi:hypothetical protein
MNPFHFCDDCHGFGAGEDCRNSFGLAGADGKEGRFVQLDLQDIPVQEKDGADGLIPPAPPAGAVWVEADTAR